MFEQVRANDVAETSARNAMEAVRVAIDALRDCENSSITIELAREYANASANGDMDTCADIIDRANTIDGANDMWACGSVENAIDAIDALRRALIEARDALSD